MHDGLSGVSTGRISYLHIPAKDPQHSAAFYQTVFGRRAGGSREHPSFEDGTGHVTGHWVTDLASVGEAGGMPYIYVDDVHAMLTKVTTNGGEVVKHPYPEGDLTVATFRDPAGNVLGIWQRGPR